MDKKNRRKIFDIFLISSLEEIKLSNNVNCQKSDTNKIKYNNFFTNEDNKIKRRERELMKYKKINRKSLA